MPSPFAAHSSRLWLHDWPLPLRGCGVPQKDPYTVPFMKALLGLLRVEEAHQAMKAASDTARCVDRRRGGSYYTDHPHAAAPVFTCFRACACGCMVLRLALQGFVAYCDRFRGMLDAQAVESLEAVKLWATPPGAPPGIFS